VGLEVDLEEEIEVEGRADDTTTMRKVTWPNTALIQDDHDALIIGIMGMQLKTAQN
jgi:hypothetical protein